ncbi:hypothetical protein B1729_09920 [Microbacterium sp. B35-04]|uniref:acyltransferase family protein n=1 Tax=Microbacterium sp. B35-04 TaxID=1961716 RepID=UPI0013D0BFE4|nr:acyltransferase [Microbacterium sp. B35-04]KAF2413427.1 hypothetical protein B1729_09920 [Microbacterium sp. B35-04]
MPDIANAVRAPHRITSLDGLRGVAALVVVLNHVLVTSPILATVANDTGRAADGSLEWWISYTPVHLLWGGTEAVFIFFILSGYVLTGPALRASASWLVYYPKRLLRLYLPVWGSLVVAGLSALIIVRGPVDGASWWVNAHGPLDIPSALMSGLLLWKIDFLNNPLWSLMWEMWFSLLLPLYVWIGRWASNRVWRTIALLSLLAAVMASGSIVDSNALRYLPMFMFGVLMYFYRGEIQDIGARMGARHAWLFWVSLVVAVLSLTSYWMAQAHTAVPGLIVSAGRSTQVVGACLFVLLALTWPAAQRLLDTRPLNWLGRRSFSLYLTHDAVVISTVLLLGGNPPWALTLLVVVPIALLAAELFFRLVESPSHRFSQMVGGSVQRAVDRRRSRSLTRSSVEAQ